MKRSIFCGTRISAFIALPSLVRASWKAMEKPRLGMNGNGCAGSIASGVSTGKMYLEEVVFEPGAVGLLQAVGSTMNTMFAALSSSRNSRQRACWSVARLETPSLIRASCSPGVSPSGLRVGDAVAHLRLEAGDADHEEFVEVVGRDRKEADLLEQRMLGVFGLFQDPAVEMQPGQLPVDETFGAGDAGRERRQPGAQLPRHRRNRRILP